MKTIPITFSIIISLFLTSCDNAGYDAEQKAREKQNAIANAPDEGKDFVSGPVVKIYRNDPNIASSSITMGGASGETVKLGETIWGIHVQTPQGLYVIQFQGENSLALSSLISVNTQVRFPTKYHYNGSAELRDLFSRNNISYVFPSIELEVIVLPEK